MRREKQELYSLHGIKIDEGIERARHLKEGQAKVRKNLSSLIERTWQEDQESHQKRKQLMERQR